MFNKNNKFEPVVSDSPSADDYYTFDDMDLASLDSYYGDEDWSRQIAMTGSVQVEIGWDD